MSRVPRRTERTPLTDAELYLFDAMFDVSQRLGALRREEFAALNLPYTHDLDAVTLDSLVRRLAAAGLLRLRSAIGRPDLGPWVQLTAEGGRLWDLERAPDWSRFCRASSRPEGPRGHWVLRIRAAVASVAEAYLDTAHACRLHSPDMRRLSRRQLAARVVPWKRREPLVELRVRLLPAEDVVRVTDWRLYEGNRTWWQAVPELIMRASESRS